MALNTAKIETCIVAPTSTTPSNLPSPPPQKALASGLPLVTFGTYNYTHHEILEDATNQAMYLWSHYRRQPLIDTAMKYKNLRTILKVLERSPNARIGWKVEHSSRSKVSDLSSKVLIGLKKGQTEGVSENDVHSEENTFQSKTTAKSDDVAILDHQYSNGRNMYDGLAVLKATVPKDRIFRILMHNYCGKKVYLEFQHLVEQAFGMDMPIGICNVSADQLEDLVQSGPLTNGKDGKATGSSNGVGQKARVDWVQNEYHPFLETRVPDVCRKHGIRFEAHSVMTNIDGYADLFQILGVPDKVISETNPAQLALKYAAKQGGVCITTANFSHLTQDLETLFGPPLIDPHEDSLLSAMSQFSSFKRIVRYRGAETGMNVDWVKVCNPVQICEEILPRFKKDILAFESGKIPSNLCMQIPKSYRAGGEVHGILAEMLYGDDLEDQMAELKKKVEQKMSKHRSVEAQAANGTNEGATTSNKLITNEELKTRLVAKWNCKLNVLLSKMRHCITEAQWNQRVVSKRASDPVQAVEQPEALPMDSYPEAGDFADLIQFLKTGGAVDVMDKYNGSFDAKRVCSKGVDDNSLPTNVRFQYGTINSDGRLDLCKQGFRNAFSESCDAVIQDGGKELPVNIRFKYGTVNSDGRLDMCKQGFRNAFPESCDAVIRDKQNEGPNNKKPLIKHYLIGNNRIGEDGDIPGEGNRRVAALARMIRQRPDIVTWFLAGNSMDSVQIQCVAEALAQTRAKYVWLKMNPVKTGAYHLGKMVVRNPHIHLLDLFNCGLCNDGLAAFARGLADGAAENPPSPVIELRHLYISINAITSAKDVELMLARLPNLESLFLGVNPFGDEGLKEIAEVIIHKASCRQTLQRLNMGSMALTDASLPRIEMIVAACPNLVSLELDSYRSTNYFDEKHNRFDVANATTRAQLMAIAQALVHNARRIAILPGNDEEEEIPLLHFLGLQHALVVDADLETRTACPVEAKAVLDDFVENELYRRTGININGITNIYPCKEGSSYRHIGERQKRTQSDFIIVDENEEERQKEASYERVLSNSNRMVGGGLFLVPGVTKDDLRAGVRHPWPAVDHIKSIYRNTMKV